MKDHDRPAAERPAAERPAAERPAAERPAAERPAAERPAAERPAAEQPEASAGERAFFDFVIGAGRQETAPPDLGERVLAGVAYRKRLEQHARPTRPRRYLALGALSAGFAAAAFMLAARFREAPPPIAAEHPPSSTRAREQAPARAPQQALPDPCRDRRSAAGLAPLIDDFEDGDDAIAPLEQRAGFWRWPREIDAPGTAPALIPSPRPDATPHNRLAIHVKGGELVDWGATVEFTFRPSCYDASKYAGVAFAARGPGRIYVAPREPAVIPIAEGGSCEIDCHNPHVLKIDLDAGFRDYQVRWEQTRQRGKGKPALDPSRLNSIAFLIRPEDTPYDLWLDDVRFIPR